MNYLIEYMKNLRELIEIELEEFIEPPAYSLKLHPVQSNESTLAIVNFKIVGRECNFIIDVRGLCDPNKLNNYFTELYKCIHNNPAGWEGQH